MNKTYLMNCPGCQSQFEVDSIFTVRLGDYFSCSCGKKLFVKSLGNPLQMEEVIPPKFSSLKEKK